VFRRWRWARLRMTCGTALQGGTEKSTQRTVCRGSFVDGQRWGDHGGRRYSAGRWCFLTHCGACSVPKLVLTLNGSLGIGYASRAALEKQIREHRLGRYRRCWPFVADP
jgi:hypothetical protein